MRQLFLIFGLLVVSPAWSQAPRVLSTVQQVRNLTRDQVTAHSSAQIEGVVTYYEPAEHILFVEDKTGAIFVRTRQVFHLAPGDLVQVRGTTTPSYSTVIASDDIRVIGKAPLPKPAPATFPELIDGTRDCQYVTATGTILAATMQQTIGAPFLLLEVMMDGGAVDVHMENAEGLDLHKLLDSAVALTGVSGGRFDGKFQLVGATLYLNSPADMRITAPARVDPATLPLTSMDRIMGTYNVLQRTPRVRVRGSVTLYEPGSQLVIQSGDNAVLVHTHQNGPLNIGDIVDATGFADTNDYSQSLNHGQFMRTGNTLLIQPQSASWQDALAGKYAFSLISIDGRLIEQVHTSREDTLFINADGHVFSAAMRVTRNGGSQLPLFPAGSRIRVTGVCFVLTGGPWNGALDFELHLRSAQDVHILAQPSWWTVAHLRYVIGALILVVLIALIWGSQLRHRVQQQTQLIRRTMEAEAARERRLVYLEQERSRVLEAINSLLPLEQVLRMIAALVSEQMNGLECWCELASTGLAVSAHHGRGNPPDRQNPNQHRRDILSGTGERLGTLILAWDTETQRSGVRRDVLDRAASLAALAIDNRRLYEGLVRRSQYDQLTEVPNRFFLDSCLKDVFDNARLHQHSFALIYIDLDRFKSVNDRYGHRVGDIYLQHVAHRLSDKLRGQDTLARVGGDEFIVLIPSVQDRNEAETISGRLARCFDFPFSIDGCSIKGSASIGVAVFPEDGEDEDQLKHAADFAMYARKQSPIDSE